MDSCDKQLNKEKNTTTSFNHENPRLCIRGCGFYATSATNNLCSKCIGDYVKEELAKLDANKNSQALDKPKTPVFPWVKNITSSTDDESVKNRCVCCNKKVGVVGFSCRCGGKFCGIHRYPEEHSCKFDFKTAGRDAIAKQNPVCKGDKLEHRI